MFSFRESYFRLVGSFDWVYAKTKLILSVSRNRYGFTLAGYRNEKYATDPALDLTVVTLPIKSCPGYILETIRCRKLILSRDIG